LAKSIFLGQKHFWPKIKVFGQAFESKKKSAFEEKQKQFWRSRKSSFSPKALFMRNTFEKNTLRSSFLKLDQTLIAAQKCFSN